MSRIWCAHPLLRWGCDEGSMANPAVTRYQTFSHFTWTPPRSRIRIDLIPIWMVIM
jgi:hypothetical protein